MKFNRIPIEIQFDVFSNIPTSDLCTVIAPVCRQWRQFAYEPRLWTVAIFNGEIHSSSMIARVLKKSLRHLHHLRLCSVKDFSWLSQLTVCKSLRRVEFVLCTILSDETRTQFLNIFPNVQKCVYSCVFAPTSISSKIITQWYYLTYLNLSDVGPQSHLRVIAEECVNLTTLRMNFRKENDDSFIHFLEVRGGQLQCLDIHALEHISSNAYQLLNLCKELVVLRLLFAKNFDDRNLVALSELKSLQHLHICGSEKLFSEDSRSLYTKPRFDPIYRMFFECCFNLNVATFDNFLKCCGFFQELMLCAGSSQTESECMSMLRTREKNFKITKEHNVIVVTKLAVNKKTHQYAFGNQK